MDYWARRAELAGTSSPAMDVFCQKSRFIRINDQSPGITSGDSGRKSMYGAITDPDAPHGKGPDGKSSYAVTFREEGRNRLNPKPGFPWECIPTDCMRFESGGLRNGMYILCDGQNGISGESDLRSDRGPGELYA